MLLFLQYTFYNFWISFKNEMRVIFQFHPNEDDSSDEEWQL